MGKLIALLYGLVAYLLFAVSIVYAIGFVTGLVVPKTIDSGPAGPPMQAIIINLLLMGLFAVQHSVMARPQFKKWWTQFVPQTIERSTFVLFSSLALLLLFWQWQPIPAVVWQVSNPLAADLLLGIGLFGWVLVFISTFLI
ncbi:MAG: isoprenylcysteine carboxylmethyltransferase family protein, partial [Pseudolabrys sp.]